MHSKELIKELYTSLPDEIVKVISSDFIYNFFDSLATEFNLNKSQKDSLIYETTMKLVGLNPGDFINKILVVLPNQGNIASGINEKITSQIFSKVSPERLKAQEEYAQAKYKNNQQPNLDTKNQQSASGSEGKELPKEKLVKIPNYSDYEPGKDPYREPVE